MHYRFNLTRERCQIQYQAQDKNIVAENTSKQALHSRAEFKLKNEPFLFSYLSPNELQSLLL